MARCRRCFLHKSLKFVNISILIYGVALVIYSLWLNRQWRLFVLHLLPSSSSSLAPKPWFIYICLGVGIAVCLSALSGSAVSNYFISSSTLFAYILMIGCLVFLEGALVDIIFFQTDLPAQIVRYAGEYIEEVESFVNFQVKLSRIVILLVLVAQTNVIVLGVILWGIGREGRSQGIESHTSHFTESFLVPIRLPQLDHTSTSTQASTCARCGNLQTQNTRPTLFSYFYALIASPFHTTNSIN